MKLIQGLFKLKGESSVAPSGGREISETEYQKLCSADDYNGEYLSKFRVSRAMLYAASNEIIMAEPGITMLALAIQMTGKPASILEFGGGTGYHATTLRRLLPGSISRYAVVETSAQVAAARDILKDAEFYDRFPNEHFDIAFSSGALQCTQSPFGFLKQIIDLKAPIMVFARNAFSDRQIYFEQKANMFNHGAGTAPSDFANVTTTLYVQTLRESDFLAAIQSSYRQVAKIQNDSGVVGGCDAYGFDYLFISNKSRPTSYC
jgi:putative methyltransferase (TIGR04325 family)